nr:copper chaperone PCu(A)C [Saccharibacter sp. 17.LH.SD]
MRPQNSAAGYFTIRNNSATDVLLQGVTSPVCQAVSSNHNGQDLVQISGAGNDIFQHFAIPHQSTLVFPEDGYHLLCRGITKMPAPGDNVPFIFHFMDGGTVTATFKAQDITAHNSSLQ